MSVFIRHRTSYPQIEVIAFGSGRRQAGQIRLASGQDTDRHAHICRRDVFDVATSDKPLSDSRHQIAPGTKGDRQLMLNDECHVAPFPQKAASQHSGIHEKRIRIFSGYIWALPWRPHGLCLCRLGDRFIPHLLLPQINRRHFQDVDSSEMSWIFLGARRGVLRKLGGFSLFLLVIDDFLLFLDFLSHFTS